MFDKSGWIVGKVDDKGSFTGKNTSKKSLLDRITKLVKSLSLKLLVWVKYLFLNLKPRICKNWIPKP